MPLDPTINELFTSIREQCSAHTWSEAVALARLDGVTADRDDGTEIALRIWNPSAPVSPRVRLYPRDGDWSCDCGGRLDPCAHVAAAVIALKRAREQGQALPVSKRAGARLVYRLARRGRELSLERAVIKDSIETLLTVPVREAEHVALTAEDLAVEDALGGERRGSLTAQTWTKAAPALKRIDEMTLDDQSVRFLAEPVGLVLTVHDHGPAVVLKALRHPEIDEVFTNGVVRCGEALQPQASLRLAPEEAARLAAGWTFVSRDFPELVTRLLPRLATQMTVIVRSKQLPPLIEEPPRLTCELREERTGLEVTAHIVYGNPAVATVTGTGLTMTGWGVPQRDLRAEDQLRSRLERGLGLELERPRLVPPAEAAELARRITALGAELTGRSATRLIAAPVLRASLAVIGGDDLTAAFEVTWRDGTTTRTSQAHAGDVVTAWQQGAGHVQLIGGGWAPLPRDWLARFGDRLAIVMGARKENGGRLPKALQPLAAELANEAGIATPAVWSTLGNELSAARNAALDADAAPHSTTATAALLALPLRPYQISGAQWLATLRDKGLGALLADDMGLGKTAQTIAALTGRTLVVAPTSVVPNWAQEIARFRPSLSVNIYHGPGRTLVADAAVTVTSYALLRLDQERLIAQEWDMIVLDEAHMIKNADAMTSRAAFRLGAKARIALTGTPVENDLGDLWSVFRFLLPGLLGDRKSFEARFGRGGGASPGQLAALRHTVQPFVLRRVKAQVAKELPPKTEDVMFVDLSHEQRELYDALRHAARSDVMDKLAAGTRTIEVLELLLRLRQAACHAALVPGHGSATESAKLARLMELLTEELVPGGNRALVISQWTSFLDRIGAALTDTNIAFERLDGGTADRAGAVERFQRGAAPVMLLSLKAGGVGINLTAADHVFLMDPWWNPAAESQAVDRAHRIGQDKPVFVHRMVARNTVEERILLLQAEKRRLAAGVFDEDHALQALTRDDIATLLV